VGLGRPPPPPPRARAPFSGPAFFCIFRHYSCGWLQAPEMSTQSQLRPVGGLAYMVTAPTDMESALADPIHAIIYMSFMILSCGGLSYMWISVSGSSVKEEVQKMQAEGFHLASSRATRVGQTDSYAIAVLQKYIPTAALLGGMAIGACPPPAFCCWPSAAA